MIRSAPSSIVSAQRPSLLRKAMGRRDSCRRGIDRQHCGVLTSAEAEHRVPPASTIDKTIQPRPGPTTTSGRLRRRKVQILLPVRNVRRAIARPRRLRGNRRLRDTRGRRALPVTGVLHRRPVSGQGARHHNNHCACGKERSETGRVLDKRHDISFSGWEWVDDRELRYAFRPSPSHRMAIVMLPALSWMSTKQFATQLFARFCEAVESSRRSPGLVHQRKKIARHVLTTSPAAISGKAFAEKQRRIDGVKRHRRFLADRALTGLKDLFNGLLLGSWAEPSADPSRQLPALRPAGSLTGAGATSPRTIWVAAPLVERRAAIFSATYRASRPTPWTMVEDIAYRKLRPTK